MQPLLQNPRYGNHANSQLQMNGSRSYALYTYTVEYYAIIRKNKIM